MLTIVESSLFCCSTSLTTTSKVNPLEYIYLKYNHDIRPAVQEGDRIAQLIIEKIQTPDVLEVAVSLIVLSSNEYCIYSCPQDLDETLRGAGGFGSTGGHGGL
jgi:dUTP pyrophosphatase